MSSDRNAFRQLRAQARQARSDSHFSEAARLERQAVELASALGLAGERTRALLWEGYSLRQAGEDDLALAALLQAASERAASVDPADIFSALVAVIYISLEHKPIEFCRALLEQGRRYLADLRQPWTAPLDYLEGELAFQQGDWRAATAWYTRAWSSWRNESPRLTAATHLWGLCRAAFHRHDVTELAHWVARLRELAPTAALDREMLYRAQLLLWRAQRAASSTPDPHADANAAAIARILLAETAAAQGGRRDTGARSEAEQVLALLEGSDNTAAVSAVPLG